MEYWLCKVEGVFFSPQEVHFKFLMKLFSFIPSEVCFLLVSLMAHINVCHHIASQYNVCNAGRVTLTQTTIFTFLT